MSDGTPPRPTPYRLFWTDGLDRIDGAPTLLEAEDDAQAIAQAREKDASRSGEVWQGARLVAKLKRVEEPRS